MIIATFLVFVPVFLITRNSMENHGLWLSLILFLVGRGAGQTLMAKRDVLNTRS